MQDYAYCPQTDKLWHNYSYTQKNYQRDKEVAQGAVKSGVRCLLQLIGLELPNGQDPAIRWPAWIHCNWKLLQPQLMWAGKYWVWPTKRHGRWPPLSLPWWVRLLICTVRIIKLKGKFPWSTQRALPRGNNHWHHPDFYSQADCQCRTGTHLGASSAELQSWMGSQAEWNLTSSRICPPPGCWTLQLPPLITSEKYRLSTSEILNPPQQIPIQWWNPLWCPGQGSSCHGCWLDQVMEGTGHFRR